ncbi:VanW family protein [bacterium]|nr:VanW family protein [bacterium]
MSRLIRIGLVVALTPIALVLLGSVVFAMDRASNGGEVLGNVTLFDIRLGGLDAEEAKATIVSYEHSLQSLPITVEVEGTTFELLPAQVGFDLDEDAMVERALLQGREGGMATQFRWWLKHFGGGDGDELSLIAAFDPDALDSVIDFWEARAITDLPYEGGVSIDGTTVVPIYPQSGLSIEREPIVDQIARALVDLDRETVRISTKVRPPVMTEAQVDRAVREARDLLSAPVTLSSLNPPIAVQFPVTVLADALRSRTIEDESGNLEIDLFFDFQTLRQYVDPIREDIETPPMDAVIVIRPDNTPTVIPGRNGTLIEEGALPAAVMAATQSVTRTGAFPFDVGTRPGFSTEDAKALRVDNLLYKAITYFPCCGDQKNLNRINNIQLIADAVDGALVMPGENWSLNDHVGQRTIEKGYKAAGAIIGDDVYCCDDPANIGGGTSQFTTTLYGAVFHSGLTDVDHSPHTLYFTRYPEVREATLGFPSPDLEFHNNLDSAVYIKTEYTDDSVAVYFFGNNDGIEIEEVLGERHSYTEPEPRYEPNPSIPPGEEKETDAGQNGWTNSVTRIITYPDGTIEEYTWTWRYFAHPIVIEVNPCELPEDHEEYDETLVCNVQTPALYGFTLDEATAAMSAIGININVLGNTEVNDPDLHGKVVTATPPGGSWLEPGSTVDVRLGFYKEPAGGGDS